MKISEDRIRHLSKLIMEELDGIDMLDYLSEPNEIRLKIVDIFNSELKLDEEVHDKVIEQMNNKSEQNYLIDGTPEWEAEYEQNYQKEMVKRRGFEE
ncbi:MAG: DUF507 family protein [Nitrospinae bacterium]|nr:DUF507 family protein [Nitrospinota bacterium]